MKDPEKILIVRTDRLGDVILSTPVIKNLRLTYPNAHLAFMCRPYTKDAVTGNTYLDEVIVYDKYGKHNSILSTINFAFRLRKKRFDWAIILHPTNRAHLITFLAGIPKRIGWNRKLGILLTDKLLHDKQYGKKHESEYSLSILESLGIPIRGKETSFPLNQKAIDSTNSRLLDAGVGAEDGFIVLHPSASCPSKRWPQENFLSLARLLKAKSRFKIIIISSKDEAEFGELLARETDLIDFRGMFNLNQLGALLKRATLLISNDSGPVHIAASFNTLVISIFGRNDPGLGPRRWRPLGPNSYYFHDDPGCRHCPAHACEIDFICLKAITPEEVAQKALQLLTSK